MEQKKRRTFSPEYKADVVALVNAGSKSLTQISKDIGVSAGAVSKWCAQLKSQQPGNHKSPLEASESVEMAAIRRQLREVEKERDFLKKTAAFFARESV
jgi:transposase